jgi:hypothetical protein
MPYIVGRDVDQYQPRMPKKRIPINTDNICISAMSSFGVLHHYQYSWPLPFLTLNKTVTKDGLFARMRNYFSSIAGESGCTILIILIHHYTRLPRSEHRRADIQTFQRLGICLRSYLFAHPSVPSDGMKVIDLN